MLADYSDYYQSGAVTLRVDYKDDQIISIHFEPGSFGSLHLTESEAWSAADVFDGFITHRTKQLEEQDG